MITKSHQKKLTRIRIEKFNSRELRFIRLNDMSFEQPISSMNFQIELLMGNTFLYNIKLNRFILSNVNVHVEFWFYQMFMSTSNFDHSIKCPCSCPHPILIILKMHNNICLFDAIHSMVIIFSWVTIKSILFQCNTISVWLT